MIKQKTNQFIHELNGVRANLAACFRKLTADRRASNPYAQLGHESLERLDKLTEDFDSRNQKITSQEIVKKLELEPLEPEGGFFRRTYFKGPPDRPEASSILYMVTSDNFSAWHRVPHDEIFHFYSGDSVELFILDASGDLKNITLGNDFRIKEVPQFVVPGGCWQALRIKSPPSKDSWSLVGTTMTPGFSFDEFELADRSSLQREYPQYKSIIEELSR